jgi:hypothetical protein
VHKKRPRLITFDDFDFFFRPRREIYVKYVYTTQKTEREEKHPKKSEQSTSEEARRKNCSRKFDVSIQGLLSLLFSSPPSVTFRALSGAEENAFLISTISGPAALVMQPLLPENPKRLVIAVKQTSIGWKRMQSKAVEFGSSRRRVFLSLYLSPLHSSFE